MVLPRTYFIARSSSGANPTSSRARSARPLPTACSAFFSVDAGSAEPSILLSGMMVTRRRSWPLERRSLPVTSSCTTSWYSFPPHATSMAVAVLASLSLISDATIPFTLRRSKLALGSRYSTSIPLTWDASLSTASRSSRTPLSAARSLSRMAASREASSLSRSAAARAALAAPSAATSSAWSFSNSLPADLAPLRRPSSSFFRCSIRIFTCLSSETAALAFALASLSCSARVLSPAALSASHPACSAWRWRWSSSRRVVACVVSSWIAFTFPSAPETLLSDAARALSRSASAFFSFVTDFSSAARFSLRCCHDDVAFTSTLERSLARASSSLTSPPICVSFLAWRALISTSWSLMSRSVESLLSSSPCFSACMVFISSEDFLVMLSAWLKFHAVQNRSSLSRSPLPALHCMYAARSLRSLSSEGVMSSARIFWISSTLACFFSIVLIAASFFASYILVPAASAMRPRIS
mmetsp:Transcript_5659/g.13735  ORF Transcript_5659/g.13735 Transcript_5659/m.13735 type:complete len:470 (+) Transcript_5659:2188-3597(+)